MRPFLIILLSLSVVACKNEVPDPQIVDYRKVTVVWNGDYQVDGCGFFVEIDSVRYKPTNEDFFDEAFRNASDNDSIVEMRYTDLRRAITSQCGEGFPYQINGIEVIAIR